MQTDILKQAGINPKTLLTGYFYSQKIESRFAAILYLPYLLVFIVATVDNNIQPSSKLSGLLAVLAVTLFSVLILGAIVSTWFVYIAPKLYSWRVRKFATVNQLQLLPKVKLVELIPDTVHHFDVHNVQAIGCELPVAGQQVTVFDYSCVVGSGKNSESIAKGMVVLRLKGTYPHLFLDSKKNGKNHQYAANQRVELEGGFSKYFDLYIPEGSQAGSLTVFVPDMMQTILDSGKLFDVEIEGNRAVIISDDPVFTKKVLPSILNCASGLSKEFKQLDSTWQPVFAPNGKQFTLKGQPLWRVLAIGLLPLFIGLGAHLLPYKARHPFPAQPVPAPSYSDANSLVGRDDATLSAAYRIAGSLNHYNSINPVPDSLAQANITNVPPSITYTKLSPDKYQFCAKYYNYINGNGPTRASGNIVAYYGDTVDTPNLPTTLQIVEWHNIGNNCQIIKPAPFSTAKPGA